MMMDEENGPLKAGILLLALLVLVVLLGLVYKSVAGGTQIDPEKVQKWKLRGARAPAEGASSQPGGGAVGGDTVPGTEAGAGAGSGGAEPQAPATGSSSTEPAAAEGDTSAAAAQEQNMKRWMDALRRASKPRPAEPAGGEPPKAPPASDNPPKEQPPMDAPAPGPDASGGGSASSTPEQVPAGSDSQ
ncbi:MAG: hypothetical protein HYZ53_29255 [Planctomycetes bacterium]|nr:hypothetical protein [Planctomycetota bacterium]